MYFQLDTIQLTGAFLFVTLLIEHSLKTTFMTVKCIILRFINTF